MSAVPAAVDALIAAITVVLPTMQIEDGPPVGWTSSESIAVGWARDRTSVTIETTPAGFGSPDRENFDVACLIRCVSGDVTAKPMRDRAFELYGTIAAKIRLDKTLAGTVASARLSVTALDQNQEQDSGVAAELTFTVSCTAFT